MPFTWSTFAERLVWTFVSAFLGTLTGSAVLDLGLDGLQVAALAALGACANAVTQLARYRLSVLPDPGQGLVKAPGDTLDVPGGGGIAG
jgi:hypothetical protein